MSLLAIIHGAIARSVLFFMAAVPQAAFKTLSAKAVGALLRVLFPRLFLFGLVLSLTACMVALLADASCRLAVSVFIATGFAINVFVLTLKINLYRDRELDGDTSAKRIFSLLHLFSVSIFLLQITGSLTIAEFYSFGIAE